MQLVLSTDEGGLSKCLSVSVLTHCPDSVLSEKQFEQVKSGYLMDSVRPQLVVQDETAYSEGPRGCV